MARAQVAVVMVTYNRAHLLKRSIEAWNRIKFDLSQVEMIVIDDASTDSTAEVVKGFDSRFQLSYLRLRKPEGLWRDCAVNLNRGIRLAHSDLVLMTHPEVMPGRESISECLSLSKPNSYVACKPYYLTAHQTDDLDTTPWREEGLTAVRQLPEFYKPVGGNADYEHTNIERTTQWRSWVFGGMRMDDWRRLGGMLETTAWGAVDVLFSDRRRVLGIEDRIAMSDESLCIHQNHDNDAQRNMDQCMKEAATFNLHPSQLIWPAVDNL